MFPKGDKNPAKRPEVREKIRLSKLGDKNPMKRSEVAKKCGDSMRGKTLVELGHREDCTCFVCRNKRGEIAFKDHPFNRLEVRIKNRKVAFERMSSDRNPMKNPAIAKKNGDAQRGISNLAIVGDKHPLRKPEHLVKIQGENNHNWKGGDSTPYHVNFNTGFKRKIRERDVVCQECGRTKGENGKELEVHHINYDPENDCSDLDDFITLCHHCHIYTTNGDRGYWKKRLINKLKEKQDAKSRFAGADL